MAKRAELIRQSSYSDIVDCFDPRIRHAASHNAISYEHNRGMVKVKDVDANGNSLGHFELTYVEVSDKTRAFIDGLVPGLLTAFEHAPASTTAFNNSVGRIPEAAAPDR